MGRARRNQRDAQRKQRAAKRRKNVKDVDGQHWMNHEDDDDEHATTTTTTTTTTTGEHTVLLCDPLPANHHDTSDDATTATGQRHAQNAVGSENETEASNTSTNPCLSKISARSPKATTRPSIPSGLSPIERLRAKKQWRKQRQKEKQEAKKKELSLL